MRRSGRKRIFVIPVVVLALAAVPLLPANASATVPCDVSALQTAVTNANVSGGTVRLASHCIYSVETAGGPGIAFQPIVAAVTIIGGRATVIRRDPTATTSFRIFGVNPGGVLTLSNLTLQNGLTTGDGGGVQVFGGRLSTRHVTFSSNGARNGGGLEIESGAEAVIDRSTFVGNSTSSVGGGAIMVRGTLRLARSSMLYNTAALEGGAINVQPGGVAQVATTRFEWNRAIAHGGAVENLGRATFKRSKIVFNVAGAGGGGIQSVGATALSLRRTVVRRNTPDNCVGPPATKHCKP